MAQVGTATVKVQADTADAEKAIRRLRRQMGGRITWPESFVLVFTMGFLVYVIERVT